FHARHLENSLLLRQQINQATDKRCIAFTTHPTQAINSILNRYHQPVYFSNIKLSNELITNPLLIKQHVRSHFYNWLIKVFLIISGNNTIFLFLTLILLG